MATATKVSKAQEFALYAEEQGWKVEREADDGLKTVRARRDGELVEVQWLNDVALGPIGSYVYPGGMSTIKNAASAKRILALEPGNHPKPVARQERKSSAPRVRRNRPIPFDPYQTADDEVLKLLAGKKIAWTNRFTQIEESGQIPYEARTTRIDMSRGEDTLGERILTFCDTKGGGFRSCFIGAITRVGN